MPTGTHRTAFLAIVGLLSTAVVLAVPDVRFVYQLSSARTALDTAVVLVGTMVAFLSAGRFQRQRRLGDLAVVVAMALLVGADPVFGRVASVLAGHDGVRLAPRVAWLLGAAALAAASLLAPVRDTRLWGRWQTAASVGVMAVGTAGAGLIVWRASPAELSAGLSDGPRVLGDSAVSSMSLAASGLFVVATLGLTSAGQRRNDPFLAWLGAGCALCAVGSLDYALYPSSSLDLLHIGDLMRLAAVTCWLIGGLSEVRSYWDAEVAGVRADERRALARDLHDGLAQELAFIASQSFAGLGEVQAAARRALVESRRVVAALSSGDSDEGVADLAQAAAAAALRDGMRLSVDVEKARPLTSAERDGLIQIVREAVSNAARHGGARQIHLELAAGRILRVIDDGAGFDPTSVGRPSSFGLTSMRERAEAIGGVFDVRSVPGRGTVVEVSWP